MANGDIQINPNVPDAPVTATPEDFAPSTTPAYPGAPIPNRVPAAIAAVTPRPAPPARMIPMFSPTGEMGDIPDHQVDAATKAGGMIASAVISPDGKHGFVPANRLHEALKAGGKIDDTGWTQEVNDPTLTQKLQHTVTGPGMIMDPNALQNARNIELAKMNPWQAAGEIGEAGATPLIKPENAMTPEEQANHPWLAGVAKFAGALTSPNNLAMMVGMGGLKDFPGGEIIGKALSAGFGLQAIVSAAKDTPKFLDALARGDEPLAKQILMEAALNVAMGVKAGEHAGESVLPKGGLHIPGGEAINAAVSKAGTAVPKVAGEVAGKAIGPIVNKAGALKEYAMGKPATAPELVGKVTQATGEDVSAATRALKSVDTTKVKTFSDLSKTLDDKVKENTAAVDAALNKNTQTFKVADLEKKTPVKGGADIITSPVTQALNQLRDYYGSTNDTEGTAKIQEMQNKAETGLTVKDINDIARLHGRDLNAYNASGELASGLKKQAAENTRTDVKDIVRNLTPDEETKALDKNTSDLITTRDAADQMAEKVQTLQNRLEKAGLFRKVASGIGTGADIASGGFFRTLMGMAKSGDKTLNAVELQGKLAKNLALLDKLNGMDPASALKEVQKMTPGAPNPTEATGVSAPGSIELEARQDDEAHARQQIEGKGFTFKGESSKSTPENPEWQYSTPDKPNKIKTVQHDQFPTSAKTSYPYRVPTEPATPASTNKLPSGFMPGDELDHEWGHITNAALEDFGTGGIRSDQHPDMPKRATASASVIFHGADWSDPEYMARNSGKLASVVLGGAAANELFSKIPFEINHGISEDMSALKAKMQNPKLGDAAFTDDEFDSFVRYGLDRAKRNLTQPGIGDILQQNAKVRETGLSKTMHASRERTEGYGSEVRRIRDENRRAATEKAASARTPGLPKEGVGKGNDNQGIDREAGGVNGKLDSGAKTGVQEGSTKTGGGIQEKVTPEEHPTVTALKEKYGESTNPADMINSGASFLHADGTVTNIGTTDHPAAISNVEGRGTKGGGDVDRVEFINDTGSIRVRHRPSAKAGPEIVFSVPEKGVTPEQIDMMKQAVGKMGRNGNLLIESARTGEQPSESVRSWPENKVKEFAKPTDVEPMLREIGAHPEQKGGTDLETGKEVRMPPEQTTGQYDEAIKAGGAVPGGIQEGDPEIGVPNLVQFHDPQSGSTLALKEGAVTSEAVQKELVKSRAAFAAGEARKNWAEKAAQDAKEQGGGFTIDPRTGEAPKTGFMVEVVPETGIVLDHDVTAKDIQKFYDDNKQLFDENPEFHVGGYGRGLGVSAKVPDRATAEALGKKLNQISIWDAAKGEEIPTGGHGKQTNFPDYPLAQRMQDLRGGKMDLHATREPEEGDTSFKFGANAPETAVESKPYSPETSQRVSSRFPTAVNAAEDPMKHDLTVEPADILKSPAVAQRLADNILKQNKSMVFTPEESKTPKGIFDSFVRQAKDNIKYMYDRVTPENQQQDRVWYDGAHKFTKEDADNLGIDHRQAAGVLANLSPQKDWDINVSLYKRLTDVYFNKSDIKTTPEMIAKGKEFVKQIAASNAKKIAAGKQASSPWVEKKMLDKFVGKSFSELPDKTPADLTNKAAWLRIYDEAHNPREFNQLNADGTVVGVRKTLGGQPEKVAWGGLDTIAKGISILNDGSLENISRNLGDAHKVRSFYNNIIEPNSPHGDVTADTHHVGLSLMRPVAGMDPEPKLNFGGNGSSITGVNGSYPLYAEATRQAMREINAEHPDQPPLQYPRQLQSVAWVEWRKMFPAEVRTPEVKEQVNNIWKEHLDGKITADEARQNVSDYADKLRSGVDAGEQRPSDQGQLYGDQLSRSAAAGGSRSGGESPAGNKVSKRELARTAANTSARDAWLSMMRDVSNGGPGEKALARK